LRELRRGRIECVAAPAITRRFFRSSHSSLQFWYEVLVPAFLALLMGLALSSQLECAGPLRALADQLTDRAVRTPPFSNELRVRDAVAIDDRDWIAVTDAAVLGWRDGAERTLLELPEPRFGWNRGDLRVAANGAWSYAAAAFDDPTRVDVAFLTSADPAPRVTRVAVPVSGVPLVWASLSAVEPSGLLVVAREGTTLDVRRVTPAGAQRIAIIDAANFYPPGAAVCPLPDGRVVLAALGDDPRVAHSIVLHVISAQGDKPIHLRLTTDEPLRELAMAASPAGLLCVVARSERGALAAALVDPDHPESAGFRPMTAAADRAVMPSVTHTTDRFVVAWLSAIGGIVMREMRDDRVPLPPVTIATDVQLDNPLLSLRPSEQGVGVLARTRTGLMLWHVQTPIAGRATGFTSERWPWCRYSQPTNDQTN
jgi:hypothetical protein